MGITSRQPKGTTEESKLSVCLKNQFTVKSTYGNSNELITDSFELDDTVLTALKNLHWQMKSVDQLT